MVTDTKLAQGSPGTTTQAKTNADRVWGLTRISIGLVFLWAFFDKLFALGFATGRAEDGTIDFFGEAAWVSGGSPTYGFLEFGTRGPFEDFFRSFAGEAWADWLFMAGLAGIGIALTFGIAMRLGAGAGIVMLMLMWAAALWPEHHPFLDDHVIYSLVLVGLVMVKADETYGLGRWWKARVSRDYPVLT